MIIIFESLVVSILKYIFIVHHEKSRNYGEERIQKIFFWANILHWILPSIISAYLWDIEIIDSLTSCFGIDDKIQETYNSSAANLERLFMCKLHSIDGEDLGTHFTYTIAQTFCVSKMIFTLTFGTNIPEAYFYYKIFKKMKRYLKQYYDLKFLRYSFPHRSMIRILI